MAENRTAVALIHIANAIEVLEQCNSTKSAARQRHDIPFSEQKYYKEVYSADPEDVLANRQEVVRNTVDKVNAEGWRFASVPREYQKWETNFLCPEHSPKAESEGIAVREITYNDVEPPDIEIVHDFASILIECMMCDNLVEEILPELDITLEYIGPPDEDYFRGER